jgi:hypothetical protein
MARPEISSTVYPPRAKKPSLYRFAYPVRERYLASTS